MFDKFREDARETPRASPDDDLRVRLHADHIQVANLMEELLASEPDDLTIREGLRDRIMAELTAHARAEEEVVYVWLQQGPGTRDKTLHAIREHDEIDLLVMELKAIDCADAGLEDLIQELRLTVRAHVEDEENDLLPRAEREFGREQLARLIPQFNARRNELLRELDHEPRRSVAGRPRLAESDSWY